jgi:predicted DNA-binding protein (UPF0251 family)
VRADAGRILLSVKRNSLSTHHPISIEPGASRLGNVLVFCSRVPRQNAVLGACVPMKDYAARGGEASFFDFAGAVFRRLRRHSGHLCTDLTSTHVRDRAATKFKQQLSRMTISTMNELPQVKGFQQHLLAEEPNIPSGVMQAVLMHALQLRRRCREVFLLCDIQGHSVPEAAAILGISRVTANRRLQLARTRMNEVIEHLCGATQEAAQLKSKRTM